MAPDEVGMVSSRSGHMEISWVGFYGILPGISWGFYGDKHTTRCGKAI